MTAFHEIPISSSPHKSLNFCQGIIRDRDRDLNDMSEEEICSELKEQKYNKS